MIDDDTPTREFDQETTIPLATNTLDSTDTAHSGDMRNTDETPPPANTAPPLWSTDSPQQHIHVPRQVPDPSSVTRKTDPSTPTLLLAAMMLVIGVVASVLVRHFPDMPAIGLVRNPTVIAAIGFASLGIVLLIIAIAWGIAKGTHTLIQRRRVSTESSAEPDRGTSLTSSLSSDDTFVHESDTNTPKTNQSDPPSD